MNALGGTRGERNAKPKFAALDINKLYSTSRGESLEPSTQKSAAPRKHGMQSLGKVPSARRPPANLPSLKAEISIPSDQQGTWGSEAGDNQNNNSSITSTSVAPVAVAGSSTNNNASVGAGGVHNTSHASSQQIPHSSASSSSQWSSNEFPSLDGTGQYGPSGKQQHHHLHDGTDGRGMGQYMDGPQVSLRPQTDAASWMQQQQQSSGGGNNAGGMNGPNNSQLGQGPQQQPAAPLPPQFRALMPPFMYRGNGGGGGNSVTPPPSSNEDMNRGNTGGGSGGGNGGGMRGNSSNMGYNSMLPSFVAPPPTHHQSHGSNYSPTQSGGRYRDSYSGGRRGQMQPPRLANRQQQHPHDDHRSSQTIAPAYVEPDILVQRPIIRDEELQRIEAIAKDEGWAKDDEIDYNQKLQFSDDELEPSPPKEILMPIVKQEKSPPQTQPQQQQQMQQQQVQQQQSQQEDDKRMAWSREVEREQERLEQEQIERVERERQERERAQGSMRPVQQNGHVGGRGLDAEAKERLKQRREEDHKREMERKQAAARKLQELEQKLNRKKNDDNVVGSVTSPAVTKDDEDRDQVVAGFNESGESKERSTSSVRGGDRDSKEYRDRDRDRFEYGRHDRDYRDRDRGERDRSERDRTERTRVEQDREREGWGEVPPYSKNFQSNLPPRFQKRKLERNPSGNSLQGSGSYITRDQNITRNSSTANQGSMMSQSQPQTENKSVPFAQQYDPRFIHSQQSFGKSQSSGPSRRAGPDLRDRGDDRDSLSKEQQRDREMIPREIMKRRIDSEEDDRFSSSGRESSSKLSGGRTTPQLVRSVSDTSQRKTSVSSDDNSRQMDHHHHHNSSREIIGSWESETEKEDRRQAEAAAALAKENQMQHLQMQQPENRRISESSEGEPKQILQRIKESSPVSAEESSKARNDESKTNEPKLLTTAWEETVEAAEEEQLKASEVGSSSIEDKKDVSGLEVFKTDSGKITDHDNKMSVDSGKEMDDNKYGSKKPMHPRGTGRHEPRGGGHSRGGFGGGSGFHRGGSSSSWGRRGGPGGNRMSHGRNYNQDYWSESDYSDDGDEEFRKDGKYERKEGMGNQYRNSGSSVGQPQNMKEGFAPRGEPSRRGRGGMSSAMSGPGFRKTTVGKKMDGYGPPSSKSPFGSSEEKPESKNQSVPKDAKPTDQTLSADDRTKQKQAALSAGLTNKPVGGPKPPTSGSLPQRSPSGNMKPPGKPAEETLSDQEKLKASLEKKTRNDSKTESHDEKLKEKPKTESESHDTDDASKDSLKAGQSRPKQQQPPGIKSVQSSSTVTVGKPSTTTAKPNTVAPPGAATTTGSKSTVPAAPVMQQPKPNQDPRGQTNNRSMNITPRMVKPKERRDGGFQDGQQSGGETNESESNVVASSQQQPVQEKVNTLNVNSSKTDNSKQHLDGATPPVNTIIFENTNYKSSTAVVSTVPQHIHQPQQVQQPLQIQVQQQQQQGHAPVQIKRQHSGGGVPGPLMALHQQQQQQQQQQHQLQQQQMVQMVKQEHAVRHPSQEEAFKVATGVPQPGSMHDMMEQQQPPQRPQSANGPQQPQQQLQQNQVPLQQQIPQQQQPSSQADAITNALHNMTFPKPAEADYDKEMKPFTFDADISQLIEAKNKAAGLCLPKAQNMISPSTAELNMKIASVKKVWEMPSVPEHVTEDPTSAANAAAAAVQLAANFAAVNSQHQQHLHQFQHSHSNLSHAHQAHTLAAAAAAGQSYGGGFGQDQQSLDQHFNKANNENVVIGGNAGGNDGDNNYNNPQHAVVGQGNNVQHQAAANMNMKHDVLSSNVNVCKVKPTQQNMHQSTGLGLSPPPMQGTIPSAPQTYFQPSQYGMSAIPSPPAVIYNSSAMPSQGGLYNAFQIEAAGRSQFSQFPGHYGTTGTGPYNAYMTTPPNLQTAPTPDMYPSITSQFRMGGAVQSPYNPSPSQQMNNPSTMLISSSTNSLMSSSVKPSSQQIGAIGSKSGSVGQPYGQQYMGMFQPAPPLQNNSFYSNSAGGQSAFFGGAGATQNYGIPAAAAGMFGGHGAQTPSNAPPPQQQLPNYPNASQFLNSPLALAANAISQQFRGGPTTNPQSAAAAAAYMKGNQPQSHMQDPNGRQLKSPLNSDAMNNLKQIPPQASPPHHKGYATAWDIQNQLIQQQQQQNQQSNQQQQPPQQQNPQQHPQQQMNQPPQSQQPNPNRNMMPPNQQPPAGLGGGAGGVGGRPPQGVQGGGMAQRYPSPIQRPTNYSQAPVPGMHQQRPIRQSGHNPGQQQQANMAQAMGNPNKHYYGGNRGGGHVNALNEQSLGGKPGGNEKPVLDGDVNKDDSKKK